MRIVRNYSAWKPVCWILTAMALASCGQASQQDTDRQDNGRGLDQPAAIFTDLSTVEASFALTGEFVQGARWQEGDDDFFVLISKEEQGEFFAPDWESRLYVGLYRAPGGNAPQRVSTFVEEAGNVYSGVSLATNLTRMVDLPDGRQGVLFGLRICPDGEDPCELKVCILTNSIRYDLARSSDAGRATFEAQQAAAVEAIPSPLREQMVEALFVLGAE